MATIKPTFTTDKINKYLKKYREITFQSGTYNLTEMLKVYSDTIITCQLGVVFKRKHTGKLMKLVFSKDTTEYNGTHDVTWTGGRFVHGEVAGNASCILMAHARNITFKNIVIDGCVGPHCIEINSSDNVKILNCVFNNHAPGDGKTFREAIQIDFAHKDGFAVSGADGDAAVYDGTHCNNITISECSFDHCHNGVGTHTIGVDEKYHTNIEITNCKFTNMTNYAIKVLGMDGVVISGCAAEKILVNKMNTAHKLRGGKMTVPMRYNANVKIDNVIVS